jgi:transcriptional regulator with XRE-family HTH domain
MGYEVIKVLAKEKGKSLEYIANHAGITYNSLSKIIRNLVKAPKYATIMKISEALNMDINEFAYEIGMIDTLPKNLKSPKNITLSEHELIEKYRYISEHSSEGKKVVDLLIEYEFSTILKMEEMKDTSKEQAATSDVTFINGLPSSPEELEKLYPPINNDVDDKVG